jgi:hypothetical protein
VKRGALTVVVALVVVGVLATRGAAWLRDRATRRADPGARLPANGLLLTFRGDPLGTRLDELRRFPAYRGLVGGGMTDKLRRAFRWGPSVKDPWAALSGSGSSVLGLYRKGWIVVRPGGAALPAEAITRDEGAWRLVASERSMLPSPGARRKVERTRGGGGGLEIEADLGACLEAVGGASRDWEAILPRTVVGSIRAEGGRLEERWEIACGDACLLEWLDARGTAATDARAWAAVSASASSLAWFLLDPRRLASPDGAPTTSGTPRPLARLEQMERFLGFPLRKEIASALAGPGVAALEESSGNDEPRLLLALDLAFPERASRALDRVAALGVLSGAMHETTYRGVSIASWAFRGRRGGIEPAAAVDGGLLLLALRRADVADAIDRLRSARPSPLGGLRAEAASLPAASWKAASRSPSLVAAWERILGLDAPAHPSPPGVCRATLRKEGNLWILEGDGAAPALAAEPLFPSLRRLARDWQERESR